MAAGEREDEEVDGEEEEEECSDVDQEAEEEEVEEPDQKAGSEAHTSCRSMFWTWFRGVVFAFISESRGNKRTVL